MLNVRGDLPMGSWAVRHEWRFMIDTDPGVDVLVGRQAILDYKGRTVAYELLYRSIVGGQVLDSDMASASVLVDGVLGLGLQQLTEGRPAYVNVPESLLVAGHLLDLDLSHLVVEVLEDTCDTPAVRDALRRLRARGFRLALDDVVAADPRLGLLPYVDVAKIDVLATSRSERDDLVRACRDHAVTVLFEKIETQDVAEEAAGHGVELLQGFFFARPQLVRGRDVRAMDGQRARLLIEANRPEPDLAVIEQLIRGDLYLAERFLGLVNAAAFGWRRPIETVRHALVLMGQESVRKWLALVVLAAAASGKPSELVVMASARARFLEELADASGMPGRMLDLFAAGMFSVMDAVLDRPLAEAVASLPVADDVRAGIVARNNRIGRLLDLAEAFERGEWERTGCLASQLGLSVEVAAAAWGEAMRWSTPSGLGMVT